MAEPSTSRGNRFLSGYAIAAALLLIAAVALAWLQPVGDIPSSTAAQPSWWSRLLQPVETNPDARAAKVKNQISAIFFLPDDRHGWAVGHAGIVLLTTDGGRHWHPSASRVTRADLLAVQFASDGKHGWALDRGEILASADGGETWKIQYRDPRDYFMSLAFAPDGVHGWAVGAYGLVVATADGGDHWTLQVSNTDNPLWHVAAGPDGKTAWAVGILGTIVATTDGGATWQPQVSNTTDNLGAVSFAADGKTGWAVGSTVLNTQDGGLHWTTQAVGTSQDLFDSVAVSPDGRFVWIVTGGAAETYETADSGAHWRKWPKSPVSVTAPVFDSRGIRGWAIDGSGGAYAGTIVTSADGGQHWTPQTMASGLTINKIHLALDGQHGWAVGADGRVLVTHDGGAHWSSIRTEGNETFANIDFAADHRHGWALTDDAIFGTFDGGHHWSRQAPYDSSFFSTPAINVSPDGRHVKVNELLDILETFDGGRTWRKQPSDGNFDHHTPSAMAFSPDGKLGWIADINGSFWSTDDGGVKWDAKAFLKDKLNALDVVFARDGRHGWILGDGLYATDNGGVDWHLQTTGVSAGLNAMAFADDGQHGWVVGNKGTVIATTDGGAHWFPQDSNTKEDILTLDVSPDGRHAIMAGDVNTARYTTDGGVHWRNGLRYSRAPAPWFYAALGVVVLLFWLAWRRNMADIAFDAAAMATSDNPVEAAEQDRLDFLPLSRGISRYLRNTRTFPPLTLAVTGPWGSGKSSLMKLIRLDLKRFGYRAVWFNAWHHQQEEQLLVALLDAIAREAPPRLLSLAGIPFRLSLLLRRSKTHFLVVLLAIAAAAFAISLYLQSPDVWSAFWRTALMWAGLAKEAGDGKLDFASARKIAGQLVAGLLAAAIVVRAMKPFGIHPSVLLTSATRGLRIGQPDKQAGFRARFARDFADVTASLPHPMVLVVDDLDRCQPEAVLAVMEAVNFLVSSGTCFVIFGMADDTVECALGLSFEKIAAEAATQAGDAADPDSARDARRAYAHKYLEKLINLEVPVPDVSNLSSLLVTGQAPEPSPIVRLWGYTMAAARKVLPAGCILAVLAIAWWGGANYHPVISAEAESASTSQTSAATGSVPQSSVVEISSVDADSAEASSDGSVVEAGDNSRPDLWWLLGAVGVALSGALAYSLWQMSRAAVDIEDSDAFRTALEAWTPLVQANLKTPRAIKRFGNRVRYFAMLQEPENAGHTSLDAMWDGARNVVIKLGWMKAEPPAVSLAGTLSEDRLVALGALYEIYGDDWRGKVNFHLFSNAIADCIKSANQPWPPTQAELDAFDKLIKSVRLSGDRLPAGDNRPLPEAPRPTTRRPARQTKQKASSSSRRSTPA